MLLNTDKLISDVVEFTERRMPKAQSQALVDLEAAFEQLQAENKKLRKTLNRFGHHDSPCAALIDEDNSKCSCGYDKALGIIMAYGTEERMWTLEEYIEKYEQLQAENKELQEKYQAYTTGKAKNYHDVWCNASRDEPMGCSECSCTIGKQIKKLQAENKRLRKTLKIENENFVEVCRACRVPEAQIKEHNDLVEQAMQPRSVPG